MLARDIELISVESNCSFHQDLDTQQEYQEENRQKSSAQEQNDQHQGTSIWRKHLVPQDYSIAPRKLRRYVCLSFLCKFFTMIRASLLQPPRKNFSPPYFGISLLKQITAKPKTNRNNSTYFLSLERFWLIPLPKFPNALQHLKSYPPSPPMTLISFGGIVL